MFITNKQTAEIHSKMKPATQPLRVTVMCYSPTEDALLAAYESGLVVLWLAASRYTRYSVLVSLSI